MIESTKSCTCKGIRTCIICNPEKIKIDSSCCKVIYFCPVLNKAVEDKCHKYLPCSEYHKLSAVFDGIYLLENFLTDEDKLFLTKGITSSSWVESQSGRRKQDFGPKVNFKKRKVNMSTFFGLPRYIKNFVSRFSSIATLDGFIPVELCNLEYDPLKAASIDPHFDDSWLWGERLVTLNIQASTFLSFTPGSSVNLHASLLELLANVSCSHTHTSSSTHCSVMVKVPMPEGSLIVVSGDARHKWMHSIVPGDITHTRVATTLRELSEEFAVGGHNHFIGQSLTSIALSFNGS